MTVGNGKTLCIPTIFISYTGETLDYKGAFVEIYPGIGFRQQRKWHTILTGMSNI
jgi:glutamine synthetase type III